MFAVKSIAFFLLSLLLWFCGHKKEPHESIRPDWSTRKATLQNINGATRGETYLPVYSNIYQDGELRKFSLNSTISIRNISTTQDVYILKIDYYDTTGKKVRGYLDFPIFVKPLETIEIVVADQDKAGGSGANFIFAWATEDKRNPPLFEAIMISTRNQQGLSFATRGVQIH